MTSEYELRSCYVTTTKHWTLYVMIERNELNQNRDWFMRRSKRVSFMSWVARSPRPQLRKSSAFVRWPEAPCSCSVFIRDRRDVSSNLSSAKLLSHWRTWGHVHGRKRCARFRFVSPLPSARCLVVLVFLAFFSTALLLRRSLPSIPLDTSLFAYRRAFVFVFSLTCSHSSRTKRTRVLRSDVPQGDFNNSCLLQKRTQKVPNCLF